MIYFYTHVHHFYTIKSFLDGWGRSVRPRMTLQNYSDLRYSRYLPPGAYILADSDRLDPAGRKFAAEVGEQILARGWPLLNRPSKLLYRVELMNTLRAQGLSRVGAYLVDQIPADLRYPAFVRIEDNHNGRIGPVVNDRAALEESIKGFGDVAREKLFVMEFCDTKGPDNIYRKYGVQIVGDKLIPRHVFFGQDWIVKYSKYTTPDLIREEEVFVSKMPDDQIEQCRKIFEISGTTYGRLDYSLADGKVQPWEINLNPMLCRSPDTIELDRLKMQGTCTAATRAAFHELADRGEKLAATEKPLELKLPDNLRSSVGVTGKDRRMIFLGRVLGRAQKLPVIRPIVRACKHARWIATR